MNAGRWLKGFLYSLGIGVSIADCGTVRTGMYEDSPGFSVLVNTEVDSMGGVIDDGVGLQDKTSPRRAAIEKAQAELRQEYFLREERKRELEFLEKGGNPLDFKFGPTTPVSIQSTSLTDQLLDYDAKGSSALAASPHGDSVDSSGRPGVVLGREPNTADNLLLIDGQNSNHDGTKNEIRSGRRKTIASSEHSSKQDGSNVKESDESGVFRFGVKSQAYARRNRSRPSRDNAYLGSAHVPSSTHGNDSSLFPSSVNSRDKKSPLLETQVEENAVSSISNSKPASPSGNNLSRALDIDDQVEMDIDASEAQETSRLMLKADVREGEAEVTTSKHLQQNGCNENAKAADGQRPNGTISLPCELTVGEALSVGAAIEPILTDENMGNTMKSSLVCSKNVVDLQNQDLIVKHPGGQTVNEASASKDVEIEPSNANSSADSHGGQKLKPACDATLLDGDAIEKSDPITIDVHSVGDEEPNSLSHELVNSHVQVKHEELTDSKAYLQSEGRQDVAQKEGKLENSLCDTTSADPKGLCPPSRLPISVCGPSNPNLYERTSSATSQSQPPLVPGKNLKLSKKASEDAILKEARIIEAKLKRVNELSLCNFPLEKRCKSHWDYVIEEMAWLANDFTQERIWKIAAASQISRFIASSGRLKFENENLCRKQRKAAHSMAKAVMSFWQLAEVLRTGGKSNADVDKDYHSSLFLSWKSRGRDAAKKQGGENLEEEGSTPTVQIPILGYAVRFLQCNNSCDHPLLAEAPVTPERVSDAGVWGVSMEDQSSEENLFYLVPAGAMHIYRESIESCWLQHEKASKMSHREDYEASTCDSLPEYVSRENAFEEDEAETSMQYLPGVFESTKPTRFSHKKKKTLQEKTYGARAYEVRSDLPYGPYLENRFGTQPSLQTGKRPVSTFSVCSIPTKRMRTASRQRIVSPFSTGNAGGIQMSSKTSSGDTSSFQDDHSSLQCGSHTKKNAEVESTADFEKKILFDATDISNRSKKRKKLKHMGYNNLSTTDVLFISKGSSYEHRWQDDPMSQHDQKDHLKKRFESHHFDSNGNPVIQGQHTLKKPKLLKQLAEASPETIIPATGSIPSPAASQMSSMSNPNKLIKLIAGRDRGRKNKALKITAGQLGSAGSWSQFEDQALVVLVHDMGRNWELVSDAINSALQFKCIFRKPNECKERHKVLMDRSAGDGADSAEDSGSSQSYPSTLPGIPKGSARQLFQRLQGPMEEDTLKSHFEKIILIGRQLHFRRNQGETKEMKQMTPVHNSHFHALSQACPSNLTGSPLTPLDLCEITPSPEPLGLGYQGSHPNGLPMSTHPGALAPGMTTSGPNSMLLGAPGLGMNNGLPSPALPIAPTRDSQRYGIPRPPPFPVDEQQKMHQQYSQMLSGRNMQQPSMLVPGALLPMGTDRNVRMLSSGNNMGMMCGMNNGMPMARPSFQGIGSPAVPNMVTSGSILPSGGVGMSSPVNAHSSNVTGQGSSLLRSHDHLQMPRPPQNPEDHKQMMMQDLQLQVTQGTCQSVAPVSGMSTTFSSQGTPPSPIQTFSAQQHQQPHQISQQSHLFGSSHHPQIQGTNQMNPQQQAYAMRLAKERQQLQQRLLHQQQFSGSNDVTPSQNSSQISQQSQSPAAASISSPQAHNKQPTMARNPLPSGGMPNPMINQRQRQQLHQQQPRHQQQRQQPQQQGNLSKGLGGGNMSMYQNVPLDASHVNTPTVTGNKVNERHLLQQGQGLFTGGSASGSALPQSSSQQKIFVRPPPRSSKSVPSMSTHPDACNQSLPQGPNHSSVASQQSSLSRLPLASQQQQRQTSHSQQAVQRMMLQQNHRVNSDGQEKSTVDSVQVNQMIVANLASQGPDTGNSLSVATSSPLSTSHWKPEPSYDTTIPAPTVHLATSPQHSMVGTEATVAHPNQGLTKRPFSGSLSMRVHSIGGQWQQPKQPQPPPSQDQQRQQHPLPQHQQQQHQQHQPSQHQQPH